MESTKPLKPHKLSNVVSSCFFSFIIYTALYSTIFIGQLEAQTGNQIRVCQSNRAYLVSTSSSKATIKALKDAARRGRLTIPISSKPGTAKQGGCSRKDQRSGTVKYIKIKSFNLLDLTKQLSKLLESLASLGNLPNSSEVDRNPNMIEDTYIAKLQEDDQTGETPMAALFPPAPSDTHPVNMPRNVRTFLQNRQFAELNGWAYDINKDLVVAMSRGLNLYTIGGDDASPVSSFCYECLSEGEQTLLRTSSGLSSLNVGISRTSSGQTYTSNITAMSGGTQVTFDSFGRLKITINDRSATFSLEELQDPKYNFLSNGQSAQFFTIVKGDAVEQYTWRYLTLASSRRNVGIIIAPLGGISRLGNFEGAFIDFQDTSSGSFARSVNPIEYYFGTRSDRELGVSRVDVTMVFPYGIRLRANNILGQPVRVQYSGLLSGLVTLPLVTGNPARIDEIILQNYAVYREKLPKNMRGF